MRQLRAAWAQTCHEWAVRPTGEALVLVALVPVSLAAFYAVVLSDPSWVVNFLLMFFLGWQARMVWLRIGKVKTWTMEWECQHCGQAERVYDPAHSRITFAHHLREAHGVEAMPDDLQ